MLGDLLHGTVQVPAWSLALMAGVLAVLGLVLWSVKRHADPRLEIHSDAPMLAQLPSIAGLTHGCVIEGNAVELFENGAFFDALFQAIGEARASVHFETFLWKEGELGGRLARALGDKAREGVAVRVLLDANGCKKIGDDCVDAMKRAGCKVVQFHARRLKSLGQLNRRDHRKLCVVDGRVAFAGGHCIVDQWLGEGQDKEHFRDLGLRLHGPAVHALQSAFSENWVDETGELFVGDDVFPPLERAGEVALHVARVTPDGSPSAVKILHHLVLCLARERLWIQNPYFLPDGEAIDAMLAAVKRGVDVRVMVPSADASDMPIVQHAAHHNFEKLLQGGVRVFEYRTTLIHQKTITIDGVWCSIGSANFDDRSFEINDEITLGLRDAALARRLEEIFERDMAQCDELALEPWRRRGALHKLKDRLLYLFNEQL
jgi:cardiolipin synthase A/B